jgi:transcription elongation factor GreA
MTPDYLSKEKYDELVAELEDLRLNKRRAVAERLEYAKSLGDLSENAEYHSARDEQAEIEDRINQLEVLLKSPHIIAAHHSVIIEVGSSVVVKREGGKEQHLMIVGSEEADLANGKISYQSPLGSALLGKKKGDTAEVDTPKGVVNYKIVSID